MKNTPQRAILTALLLAALPISRSSAKTTATTGAGNWNDAIWGSRAGTIYWNIRCWQGTMFTIR